MKRLLFLIVALALTVAPASAATEYMLNFTQFNPYSRTAVAGPFATLNECMNVKAQQSYVPGGTYSCDIVYY